MKKISLLHYLLLVRLQFAAGFPKDRVNLRKTLNGCNKGTSF